MNIRAKAESTKANADIKAYREPSEVPLPPDYSLTVIRALKVLSAFSATRTELGVSEVARKLQISRTASQRIINSLESESFIEKCPETRKYKIGIRAYQVGELYGNGGMFLVRAQRCLSDLSARTGHTAYLSMPRQDTMAVVAVALGSGPLQFSMPVGSVLSMHGGANGRAALSRWSARDLGKYLAKHSISAEVGVRLSEELAKARRLGYATLWDEGIPGVGAVAVAICDQHGKVMAVLCLGFPITQVSKSEVPGLGAILLEAAKDLRNHIPA